MTSDTGAREEGLRLTSVRVLTDDEAASLTALSAAAATADGVSPLDDQVRTEIAYGAGPSAVHLLGRHGAAPTVVAYSHVVEDDAGASAHLVVHPGARRRGFGAALVEHLLGSVAAGNGRTLRVWAHGDLAAAQAVASAWGFRRVRDLWRMRRPLAPALPDPTYPADVTIRTFEPGRDDAAWLAVNAAAFADHPEQGRLTLADLRHRIDEPWFDAAGFFLAERAGRLVGFHWTKVHPGDETGGPAVGEVYAVGVHPDAQGLGLGKALTVTGLLHLRERGLGEVMLYVDGDNSAAGLYARLGFVRETVDVMYAREPSLGP